MNNSITFPESFRAIKGYPGYFWNIEEKRLYSLKIGGILRPLKMYDRFYHRYERSYSTWNHYQLSVNGSSVNIGVDKILKLLEDPHTIPKATKHG